MDKSEIKLNDAYWKDFYKVAGTAAVLIVLAGLVDTITSMLGGEARETSSVSVLEWFTLFQSNPFYALSNLGLINIITLTLGIPLYLALYNIHRRDNPGFAMLAAALFFIGTAVYTSTNTVFSMFALSDQYEAAAVSQKALLEAAGRAVLAQGADLTPGTFMGFFFTQTAGMIMTSVMLRARVFSNWTARVGLVGFVLTSIFFLLAAFMPASYGAALIFAMLGGLLLLGYHLMLARRFFQLAQ
jgi:hypothetical protein